MRRRLTMPTLSALFSAGIHPALFWSLLAASAVLTFLGVSGRDTTGFFLNLSSEAWGSFVTIVLIDNVMRRQRDRERAPMLRLAVAEVYALLHVCRDMTPGKVTLPCTVHEVEAVLVSMTPDDTRALESHLSHISDAIDDITARFSHYLPDLQLATMLKLRHAARLTLIHLGGDSHRVAQELARVAIAAARLQNQLDGASSTSTSNTQAD